MYISTERGIMGKRKNIAFIVELFLLFALMLLVTVVLTGAFVSSRSQSLYAKHKTEAVILAQRAAEISMAAEDRDEAFELLLQAEGAELVQRSESQLIYTTSVSGEDPDAGYTVTVEWESSEGNAGNLNTQRISVCYGEEKEPIYVLGSGFFRKEAGNG